MKQQGLFENVVGDVSFMTHKHALLSPCGTWRYTLTRTWDESKGRCLFILLNPSTADARKDDPTMRRCIGFAQRWGFGTLVCVNLFAFRATKPKDMLIANDPVGPKNDDHIFEQATVANRIVCGWGNHGAFCGRAAQVIDVLESDALSIPNDPMCFGLTKSGQPKHPLYLPNDADLEPVLWE